MKKYIINKKTKEIHRAKYLTRMCHVKPSNHLQTNYFIAMFYIWFKGFNGCYHCWPQRNNG